MSRRKLLLVIFLSIPVFLGLIAWSPWNTLRYKGDGKFSDGGFFSYPRYVIRFPDMPLYKPGEYRFHFHGLPTEEMTLTLHVKGSSGSDEERSRLTSLSAVVDAELTDGHGQDVCRAVGRPRNTNEDGVWVLTSGGGAAYWHWQCNGVQFHSAESYNLLIRVIGPDQTANGVVVTPMLSGGGLELP